jgi:putative membrane-bound dehydrogenase-like protein
VCCWDGGVFVGSVPNIWYFKDTDGDGKADVRKIVLAGFARDAAGEGMLNSFQWRFDNRIHISTNIAGGMVRRADQPDAKPVNVKSRNILFDPRTGDFELTSGGGQHGMTIDDWGRTFVCSNSDPMSVIMYDDRYLARNPYVVAPSPVAPLMPEGGRTKIFRVSPVEPWRALRTKLRTQKLIPGSDEGGTPTGFFTGATGVTAYRGHAWPEEYKNQLFTGEVSGNLVFRAKVVPKDVGFVGQRMDENCEFLASTDNWFRPVQFANGPDGNLYVIDMYRELIEGAAFLAPPILKHMDVSAGIDKGRIWRIVREDWKFAKQPKLSKATIAELVALLEHSNGWHRDTAARLLYQRQDRIAVPLLERFVNESKSPLGRIHALYMLDGLHALTDEATFAALKDPNPRVREQALRLVETRPPFNPNILGRLTSDADARVRLQFALTLGTLARYRGPYEMLQHLAAGDGADPWLRLAVLTSSHKEPGAMFQSLLGDKAFRKKPHAELLLHALAGQIAAANRNDQLAAFWTAVDGLGKDEPSLSQALVRTLVSKQPATARNVSLSGNAADVVKKLLHGAIVAASDGMRSPAERADAVRTLGLASFAEHDKLFADLLQVRQPPEVRSAALDTLSRYEDADAAALILRAWPGLTPNLRVTAAETLFSRPAWIHATIDAVEKKLIARNDIDPARICILQAHPDAKIKARASQVFGKSTLGKRDDVVKAYQQALDLKGERERGKALFKKECAACHKLEGVGTQLGGDLNAIRNRGRESILLNILDPNREVLPNFVSYIVALDSGRTLTGMLSAETATSITLHKADGTSETILRVTIESLRSTGLSFMPEGLEQRVDVQGMADLLAYLESIK